MLKREQCWHSQPLLNSFDDLGVSEAEFDFGLDPRETEWLFNKGPFFVVDYNRMDQVLTEIDSSKRPDFYENILEKLKENTVIGWLKAHGRPWLRDMSYIRRRCLELGFGAELCHHLSQVLGFALFYQVEAKPGSRFPPANSRWYVGTTSVVQCLMGQDPYEIEIFVLNNDWAAMDLLLDHYRAIMPTVLAGQNMQNIHFDGITIYLTDHKDPFDVDLGPSIVQCYWQGNFCLTYDCDRSIAKRSVDDWFPGFNRVAREIWIKLGFQVNQPGCHKAVWLANESLEECAAKRHFECKRVVSLANFSYRRFQGKHHWTHYAKWDQLHERIYRSAPMTAIIRPRSTHVLSGEMCGYPYLVILDQKKPYVLEQERAAHELGRLVVPDFTWIVCDGQTIPRIQLNKPLCLTVHFYYERSEVVFIRVNQ